MKDKSKKIKQQNEAKKINTCFICAYTDKMLEQLKKHRVIEESALWTHLKNHWT